MRIVDVKELRKQFPITEDCVYFNTGWSGPSPTPVVEAMVNTLKREALLGPASKSFLAEIEEEIARLRKELGDLIGATKEEIALTHCTGDGLNIVYNGIDWRKGDKIVTTTLEHAASILPILRLKKYVGVDIAKVEHNSDGLFDPSDFEKAIDERTRLVTISHVTYMLGTILPVKEVVKIAHEQGVPVLLDLAQSVGCIRFNLKELDCDFAAARGGKWLLGPGGIGFLYVAKERLEDLNVASIGYQGAQPSNADYTCRPDASRFEISEPNAALNVGLRRAVKYHVDIGRTAIEERVRSLTGYLIEKADSIPKIKVLGTWNTNLKNGLVSLEVERQDASALVPMLEAKHKIVTRAITKLNAARVSLHFFNTGEEVDALTSVLKSL